MGHGIETRRLLLTPLTDADLPWLERHWNDPGVGRYLWEGRPVPPDVVRAQVERSRRESGAYGHGLYLVRLRAEGRAIGSAGLRFMAELGEPEVLYSLEPGEWGRGFATEAAAACLHFGFRQLALSRVLGGVDPPNHASTRVLRKLGMRPYRTLEIGGIVAEYYAVERAELDARVPPEAIEYRVSGG